MTSNLNRGRNEDFRNLVRPLLKGNGLDLGPWHMPFLTPNGRTILCDRYSIEEMRKVFSEFSIESEVELPRSDVVINFDLDGLMAFSNDSQDFVIASHLLEHLSQPFLFLAEIHRVLKVGGLVFIALPDKRFTFDHSRFSEKFDHYIQEIELGWVQPDNNHIDDYISKVVGKSKDEINEFDRSVELARSFHVHVFSDIEFVQILRRMISKLNLKFEFIDGSRSSSNSGQYEEFILLLRKMGPTEKRRLNLRFWAKWLGLWDPRV
jgi:predicted SAM-dependent methyltransferase